MPLINLSHPVVFRFDNESEAHDCYVRLKDALEQLIIRHRSGIITPETWAVESEVELNRSVGRSKPGPMPPSCFGPVDQEDREIAREVFSVDQ